MFSLLRIVLPVCAAACLFACSSDQATPVETAAPTPAPEPVPPTEVTVTNGAQHYITNTCWCYLDSSAVMLQVAVRGERGAGFVMNIDTANGTGDVVWWNPTIDGTGQQRYESPIAQRTLDLYTTRNQDQLEITGTIDVKSHPYFSDGAFRTWRFVGKIDCRGAQVTKAMQAMG